MADLNIFTGVVVTSNAGSGAVTVVKESYGGSIGPDMGHMLQGVVVSQAMTAYLGFKQTLIPQPGARVLCVSDSNLICYIVGVVPQENQAFQSLPSRGMLGAKNALFDTANRQGHVKNTPNIQDNRNPSDVVDGDYVVSNEFGVLLGLYQELANLKASELAQVQCYLLDDLVRIISHNFQHYTAIGEHNIYHDGKRLLVEFGATHKPAESYGRPAVDSEGDEPVFQEENGHTVDDEKDFYKIKEDERIKAIERFKLFLGSVGDFLHLYLVRPEPKEVRTLDPSNVPAKPDTGLCDLHIGTDGAMHIRSVKEVFIEKTNWIRVPLRHSAPDDPEGDDAETLDYKHKEKFNFKDEYKYLSNPFTYALQIRDYVAYVNEKLNYQNFKAHEKDFYVNDVVADEHSLKEIQRLDKETDLNLNQYELRTAGIYLMPNGGITIRDAWNSAIVMEGGMIYLQPAKDLISQPLRNNIVKAGARISMTCKKQLDMSSTEEGLRIKTEKSQYYYSDKSGFVIQSNGTTDTKGTPDPSAEAIEDIGGIVLKSKLHIYNYAEKNVVSYAKEQVLIQAQKNLDIVGTTECTLYGKNNLQLFTDGTMLGYANKSIDFLCDGVAVLAGSSGTVLGQKEQNLGVMYDPDSPYVDIIKGAIEVADYTEQLNDAKKSREDLLKFTTFQSEDNFEKLKFKFLASSKYNLDPQKDAIPTTLTQQDDLLTGNYGLVGWTEKEINDTLPYPGRELFSKFYYKAEAPKNLESNPSGKDYSSKANSKAEPPKIELGSLQNYKVQKP